MLSFFRFALLGFCCALLAAPAMAEKPLGFVTGPATGTYIAIGRDIARVAGDAGLALEVKPSGGSIANVSRLNSDENAALALVQSDVLQLFSQSPEKRTRDMAAKIGMIAPLFAEEVHVLARRQISDISQLQGKRVMVGEDGSGAMITAVNILALLDITPAAIIKRAGPEALLQLIEGETDAVILVGGKPLKLFDNLAGLRIADGGRYADVLSRLHFLPLDAPILQEHYAQATLTPQDYALMKSPIQTVAVRALLVAYDFSKRRTRCNQLQRLAALLPNALPGLKKNGHAKWQDVTFTGGKPYWQSSACAENGYQKPAKKRLKKRR